MNIASKIIVTIILTFGALILAGYITSIGGSQLFIGFLFLGLYYGLRGLWKKPKENGENEEVIKLIKKKDSNT